MKKKIEELLDRIPIWLTMLIAWIMIIVFVITAKIEGMI